MRGILIFSLKDGKVDITDGCSGLGKMFVSGTSHMASAGRMVGVIRKNMSEYVSNKRNRFDIL